MKHIQYSAKSSQQCVKVLIKLRTKGVAQAFKVYGSEKLLQWFVQLMDIIKKMYNFIIQVQLDKLHN